MGPVHCKLASQTAHQFSFSFRQHNFVFNQKRKISKMKATQSEYASPFSPKTRKMFCRDPVLHWVLRPFEIILWEDIKTLNVTHLRGILIFIHSTLSNLNIRNLKYSLCCAHSYVFCAACTHAWIPCTFHEIFRRHYFIYTNVKEDFLSLWPLTYLPVRWLLSCHNPHSAHIRA